MPDNEASPDSPTFRGAADFYHRPCRTVRRMRLLSAASIAVVVLVAVACSGDSSPSGATQDGEKAATQPVERSSKNSETFAESGLSFTVPDGWSVSGFSETVSPRRLVAATYSVHQADVEGDCGGFAAVERLPSDGSYVVLIDYGGDLDAPTLRQDFKQRLPLTPDEGQLAEFECFGRSYAFRFVVEGRGLQAHLALGRRADHRTRENALAVLNSIRVERAP